MGAPTDGESDPLDETDEPPVVVARRIRATRPGDVDLAVITCPYCGRTHVHGWVPGHRVAHCLTGGASIGYVLDLTGDAAGASR